MPDDVISLDGWNGCRISICAGNAEGIRRDMNNTTAWPVPLSNAGSSARGFTQSTRKFKDRLTRWVVNVGGLGIIGALLLIFGYLIYEVMPLFYGADIEIVQEFTLPDDAEARQTYQPQQGGKCREIGC